MEFFRDFQLLWLVVCLAGLAVSAFFYYRGFIKLMGDSKAPPKRKLRHQDSSQGGGRLVTPDSLPPAEAAKQESLLSGLKGDDTDTGADDEDGDDGYAVDQVRTTRMAPKASLGERETVSMKSAEPPSGGLEDAIRDAVAGSLKDELGIGEAEAEAAGTTAETETDAPSDRGTPTEHGDRSIDEERKRRKTSQTEVIRRAKRHEEMGLHIGIKAREEMEAKQRLATEELDDILERLDNALGDQSRPADPSSSAPSPTAAPAGGEEVHTEDFLAGGQTDEHDDRPTDREERKTAGTEAMPPAPAASGAAGDTATASPADEATDATATSNPKGYTTTKINEQLREEVDEEITDAVSERQSTSAAASPTSENALDHTEATEGEDEDDENVVLTGEDAVEGDSPSDQTGAGDEPAVEEAKDQPRQAGSADIPSWARADTFDDDQDDSDQAKQQSLFD